MRCRMLLGALALCWASGTLAANDNFALYTFAAGTMADAVAVRLDTRSGQSWYFDGETLVPIREAAPPRRYGNPAYELNPLRLAEGTVLLRLDRASGQLWAFREERWEPLEQMP